MNGLLLKEYASLLIKIGVNIQKNQILVINSPIECADLTRKVAELAYKEGARDVVINWKDEQFSKIRYMNAPEEVFDEFPQWQKEFYMYYANQGAAFLSIAASDPELMKDVNPVRISKATKASSTNLKEYRERLMANRNTWCVASAPTMAWAKKVFPDLDEDEAFEKLWKAILRSVRVDEDDPVKAWQLHKSNLKQRMDFLNSHNFKFLHFKNSMGTDLTVELPDKHIWIGGSEYTPHGVEFIANMPTEEVFTLPQKYGVNGKVVSSRPLNYNGQLIKDFSLTFKDGKIVDYSAREGLETLKRLVETDEGSLYLGEIALVPYDSPISKLNILFYNTLFDENASCHLAIGKAYPVCIKGGENMGQEELEKIGVNDSLIHEDFMIGTEDLNILGITSDGDKISVFENGNFSL